MLPLNTGEMPSPLAASSAWSGAEIFSFATGVNLAALGGHLGARAAQGKKPHQGIFSNNPALRVGEIWAKWPGTHQDSETWWRNTASGSALDANGNALSDPSGKQYSWDFDNRLTQAIVPNVGTTTFRYDPFGRRIQKSGPLGTANYLYDSENHVLELDSTGNVLAKYSQNSGSDEHLAESNSGGASYYEQDLLDSVTSLTDSGAAVASGYTYDSFGNSTASTGTLNNPFRFTGRELDPEMGRYYYRARYYDQMTGRFMSQDPLQFRAGINFYTYAQDDPINLKDPTGTTTYVCTAPLHALGEIGGELAYYTLPFIGIPTYHEYLCVWDGKRMVCGGQDRTGGALSGLPGKPSDDVAGEGGGGCFPVNDQECVDLCVEKAIQDPTRPNYDLLNRKKKGKNCQKWADETLQGCIQECAGGGE